LLKVVLNTITLIPYNHYTQVNRIGGIIVSMLSSIMVCHGFKFWSDQTKVFKIVASTCLLIMLHLGVRANNSWLRIRIMCPSGATCLPTDCCFRELTL
jgi:hypothetical protein